MKTLIRTGIKIPALMGGLLKPDQSKGLHFLIYHGVSDQLDLELDLPFSIFRRQLEFLAQTKRVISYEAAFTFLRSGQPPPHDFFILTFDDGYLDFYTHAFPLLRKWKLPAILYITTDFIETGLPYPIMNRKGSEAAKPVTWDMLGEMIESGLVTIGAHTHTHPTLKDQPTDQLVEELAKPVDIFQKQLGITVPHFAYPRAVWHSNVEALVSEYYKSAVIGGGHKATPTTYHPYRIPRIPIRRSDGWLFFLAKMRGWLAQEEALYDKLRNMKLI